MTQTTHTPGPWKLADECYSPDGYVWASDNDELVAVAGYDCSDLPTITRAANARLIAAAPDLLAALATLIEDCEAHGLTDNDAHLREARNAITKAKGQ